MGFDKEKIRQIRWLMVLAALLVLGLMYSNVLIQGIFLGFGILKPFLYGGAVAFALNIPMRAIENRLFRRWRGRSAERLKRPVSMVLALVLVVLVLNLVVVTVVPQVSKTAGELGKKIPVFVENMLQELDKLSENYPQLQSQIAKLEQTQINWESVMTRVVDFLKNGVGSMLNSTVSMASSIIGGIVNSVVTFIFALYVLSQKEKLADQGRRLIRAYLPKRAGGRVRQVLTLLNRNFGNFVTGQCLEAVILGTMFVVAMSIFRMPYAVMIGVLIAFTALIPIVGAFIGCGVGAFLILINNPIQAVWFVVLFLVLQQIEGNLIYPRVVGSSVGLPAIWVLMAVSVGGSLFGIVGMLLFIPIMSTVYALIRESVNNRNGSGDRTPVEENGLPDNGGRGSGSTGQPAEPESGADRPSRRPAGRGYLGRKGREAGADRGERPGAERDAAGVGHGERPGAERGAAGVGHGERPGAERDAAGIGRGERPGAERDAAGIGRGERPGAERGAAGVGHGERPGAERGAAGVGHGERPGAEEGAADAGRGKRTESRQSAADSSHGTGQGNHGGAAAGSRNGSRDSVSAGGRSAGKAGRKERNTGKVPEHEPEK